MTFEEHQVVVPPWLTALVEDVVLVAVDAHGLIGPLGYRWWGPQDAGNEFDGWQVVVYPTPGELRGGQMDGAQFTSGLSLDVGGILNAFSKVDDVVWHAPAHYNGDLDGPELRVRGDFLGKRVWLRFFCLPPADEPSSFHVDPRTGSAWR